ncbi:TNPO1 [Symbiodinium sp. CCMP2456]|nr:TNPO1 [Symbiodinium sp. CCMP2456]
MVIPIPGGIGTPLMGPPPAIVAQKFKIIKACIVIMIVCTCGQLLAGALLGELGDALLSSLNLILNTFIGIWMLKDDPLIGKIFDFLARSCCGTCAEQCQGGMTCLMPFIICNIITVLLQIILSSEIQLIIKDFKVMLNSVSFYDAFRVWLLLVSTVGALLAQIIGSIYGYLAYREVRDSGVTMSGGDWSSGGTAYPQARESNDERDSRPDTIKWPRGAASPLRCQNSGITADFAAWAVTSLVLTIGFNDVQKNPQAVFIADNTWPRVASKAESSCCSNASQDGKEEEDDDDDEEAAKFVHPIDEVGDHNLNDDEKAWIQQDSDEGDMIFQLETLPSLDNDCDGEEEVAVPACSLSTADLAGQAPKSRAQRLELQAQKYEREAEDAEAEAAQWARRAENAATDAGTVNEKVMTAIRKRPVLDWVQAGGRFKRLLKDPAPSQASEVAGEAVAPYVKAELSYTKSQLDYTKAASAWKAEASSTEQAMRKLQGYADQYRMSGSSSEAALYAREAETLAKRAEDARTTAEKYSTVADRITKAIPTSDQKDGRNGRGQSSLSHSFNPKRAAANHISVPFKDELLGQLRQALKDGNWLPLTVQILECARAARAVPRSSDAISVVRNLSRQETLEFSITKFMICMDQRSCGPFSGCNMLGPKERYLSGYLIVVQVRRPPYDFRTPEHLARFCLLQLSGLTVVEVAERRVPLEFSNCWLGVDPDSLQFATKAGCSWRMQMDHEEVRRKVNVKGIKSFKPERTKYEDPFLIIGAGHIGLRHGLFLLQNDHPNFIIVDRRDKVGGTSWISQANKTSKLQTELGTYHLQYDEQNPVPTDMATWPSRDELLDHFAKVSSEYGLMPYIQLETNVKAITVSGNSCAHGPLEVSLEATQNYTGVLPPEPTGKGVKQLRVSSVFMYPGNLSFPRQETYLGEDLFGGMIEYAMFDTIDYDQAARGKDVMIAGHGAFGVENIRTCCEFSAKRIYMVCRRTNLACPRVSSWFCNQSHPAIPCSLFLESMEPAYRLIGYDPWSYHSVTYNAARTSAQISQKARFGIGDVYFLALSMGKCEVIVDEVKRLSEGRVHLQSGRELSVQTILKVFGFVGDQEVDRLLKIKSMYGYWADADNRRFTASENPGAWSMPAISVALACPPVVASDGKVSEELRKWKKTTWERMQAQTRMTAERLLLILRRQTPRVILMANKLTKWDMDMQSCGYLLLSLPHGCAPRACRLQSLTTPYIAALERCGSQMLSDSEKDDEDDDDGDRGGGGGAWGAQWTARKAAASSLDNMSHMFRGNILEVTLPLIQRKLEDQNWEVQESGVLALGAIAFGCMEGLMQFMPKVMDHLLKLCQAPKPLLRSISCWTVARFSHWICNEHLNPQSQQVLRSVLQQLLQRVLDKNKRVQEAACSAFATLEETARLLLVPYLDDIVQTLSRAFQMYQAKNLLILYDAVGTLADAVGPELDTQKYKQLLLEPMFQKFLHTPDHDRSLVALFECFSSLAQNLGPSFMPLCKPLIERCTRLIRTGAQAAQMWMQNPNEFEKPDREVMAASIDLLSGIVGGLQRRVSEVLAQDNFLAVVPEVLKDSALQVKQSAFALVGDSARHCIEHLSPFLPQLLPQCAKALRENNSATVSNNASWAVGEICIKVGPDYMANYLEDIVDALVTTLNRCTQQSNRMLTQNVCITLGRLGVVCGPQMGKSFSQFARIWCLVMKDARHDAEKVNAFQGFCNMVQANPQVALQHPVECAGAIASLAPAPQHLQPNFQNILSSYKQTLGANWANAWKQMPQDVQHKLSHMYAGIEPSS